MSIRDYFRSSETMTPEQVRDFLDNHTPGEYNLVDVRQPDRMDAKLGCLEGF